MTLLTQLEQRIQLGRQATTDIAEGLFTQEVVDAYQPDETTLKEKVGRVSITTEGGVVTFIGDQKHQRRR